VRHPDLAFGGATLLIGVAYYRMATSVPVSRLADAIGPQGLPKIYALILAALSLILIITSIRDSGAAVRDPKKIGSAGNRPNPRDTDPHESRIPNPGSRIIRAAGVLVIGLVYILLAPWLGYLLAVSALIFATTYYQGGTVGPRAALIALGGGVFFWLLFVVLMGIAQPPGFFPPQL
jgi:putative tricarboxylic transport membrane protein